MLKANFLVTILAKCIYCLCSEFLVLSSLVVVQKSSNFFNNLSIIISIYFLFFIFSSFFHFADLLGGSVAFMARPYSSFFCSDYK